MYQQLLACAVLSLPLLAGAWEPNKPVEFVALE